MLELVQIKTQKMSGGAKRRHSSFGFYIPSKTYTGIDRDSQMKRLLTAFMIGDAL
jgi:hypothetical protein